MSAGTVVLDAAQPIAGWWRHEGLRRRYTASNAYAVALRAWHRELRRKAIERKRAAIGRLHGVAELPETADEGTIRAFAITRAEACARLLSSEPDSWVAYAAAANYARTWIEPPQPSPRAHVSGRGSVGACLRRLASAKWWRAQVRRLVVRRNEAAAIAKGRVHRRASACASADAVAWRRATRDRHAQLLLDLVAVNEHGETVSLADAAASGQANPVLRRHELMVRIRGLEELAKRDGRVGVFVTLTLASEYHARHSMSGLPNALWNGKTPREGHARLVTLWAQMRAAFGREGITVYGLRSAEPHHDGTPHWHLLLFVEPKQARAVRRIMRRYALLESPRQPGAWRRRVTFKEIDPAKGSAAGYVAKYVAKAVDGEHVGQAFIVDPAAPVNARNVPAGDAAAHAEHVTAWARLWGIRQFQFFGQPARVGVYRELRRVREPVAGLSEAFERARGAADTGEWAQMVLALDELPAMHVHRFEPEFPYSRLSAHGERAPHRVHGLRWLDPHQLGGEVPFEPQFLVTRPHEWRITQKTVDMLSTSHAQTSSLPNGALRAPWTRGNNCTGPLFPEIARPPIERSVSALEVFIRPPRGGPPAGSAPLFPRVHDQPPNGGDPPFSPEGVL